MYKINFIHFQYQQRFGNSVDFCQFFLGKTASASVVDHRFITFDGVYIFLSPFIRVL